MSQNFQELLKQLNDAESNTETLHKAMADAPPAADPDEEEEAEGGADGGDDAAIAAAAAAAACDDGKPTLGKSFAVTGDDGVTHEAVDATELVKSLMARQDTTDGVLAKALESFTGVVNKQGELIKSLSAQVASLSAAGRGRKSVLNITEKPDAGTLAKSEAAEGVKPEEFFAKANSMFDAGKLSGKDLNTISVCIRGNHPIDPALVQKIVSA